MAKALEVVDKDLTQIEEIKKGLGDLVARMGAVKVKTQEDYDLAVSLGKEGATSLKALKAAAELAAAPYKKGLDKIKSALNGISTAIETASDAMREQCRKFIRDENEKKEKVLRELAEKQRAEQAKAEAAERERVEKQRAAEEAIKNAINAKEKAKAEAAARELAEKQRAEQAKAEANAEKIQTKIEFKAAEKVDNSARFRKVEVMDESLVPRQYLSVDMTKLNAVKGKVGTEFPIIPGVRIYDDQQVKFG